jgi:hypothetical protein
MDVLNRALDEISYEWLLEHFPAVAEAIEAELAQGATPTGVKRAVMARTSRLEFALRCEQAARHAVRK